MAQEALKEKKFRVLTVLSFLALFMSFALSIYLHESLPFVSTVPVALLAKGAENTMERYTSKKNGQQTDLS